MQPASRKRARNARDPAAASKAPPRQAHFDALGTLGGANGRSGHFGGGLMGGGSAMGGPSFLASSDDIVHALMDWDKVRRAPPPAPPSRPCTPKFFSGHGGMGRTRGETGGDGTMWGGTGPTLAPPWPTLAAPPCVSVLRTI